MFNADLVFRDGVPLVVLESGATSSRRIPSGYSAAGSEPSSQKKLVGREIPSRACYRRPSSYGCLSPILRRGSRKRWSNPPSPNRIAAFRHAIHIFGSSRALGPWVYRCASETWCFEFPEILCVSSFLFGTSIRKSSSSLPSFIAVMSHLGFSPRPDHVSPFGPLYFGATFLIVPLRLVLLTAETSPIS